MLPFLAVLIVVCFLIGDRIGNFVIPRYVLWISIAISVLFSYFGVWVLPPLSSLPAEIPPGGIPPAPPVSFEDGFMVFFVMVVFCSFCSYVLLAMATLFANKFFGFPALAKKASHHHHASDKPSVE